MDKVYLGEMNMAEVKEYLKKGDMIFVPMGTTEQHGPHLPYLTDTLIPLEICKRAARKIGALVSPPLPYGLSQVHYGFPAIIALSGKTMLSVLEDIAFSLLKTGFKRIMFVNGHYCNEQPMVMAITGITNSAEFPKGAKVNGVTYWNVMSPEMFEKYLSWKAGWHANIGETSAVLAIDEKLVNMDSAPVEWPKVTPDTTLLNMMAAQTAGWPLATKTGVWGNPKEASKKLGEEYLNHIVDGLIRAMTTYEKDYGRST